MVKKLGSYCQNSFSCLVCSLKHLDSPFHTSFLIVKQWGIQFEAHVYFRQKRSLLPFFTLLKHYKRSEPNLEETGGWGGALLCCLLV